MSVNRGMDKEDVAHIYNGLLLSHKKERNCVICRDVDGSRDHFIQSEVRKRKISFINAYVKNGTDEPICKAEIETQM